MPMPKFFDFFGPALRALCNGREMDNKELYRTVADSMQISAQDREILLPSGKQHQYVNRINWALTYLKKAGLVRSTGRAKNVISEQGKLAFTEKGMGISLADLEKYPQFHQFRYGHLESDIPPEEDVPPLPPTDTPEETMDKAFTILNARLAEEILAAIMEKSPTFFERLVVQLLIRMGYGGAFEDAGLVVGQTNDEGIDGIIREDKLGFSSIYIQAKRWKTEQVIGRPEVQTFVGALAGKGATKGLFITTARFTPQAVQYAQNPGINTKIVLVDGKMLAKLMIENNVGVSPVNSYVIKKIDSDYFIEEA